MKIILPLFVIAWLSSFSSIYAQSPNLLFILCDDLRWDSLGCTGHPHIKTPQIDKLAASGVNFKNTFCTTSLCSPSRASILSGKYAHSHTVVNNFTEYPENLKSFPSVLHDTGYQTAYFGKWHMGEENDNPRPGFDTFITHKGQGKYFDTEFNIAGKRQVVPGYYTNVVTSMATNWLSKTDKNKPWLCMIGHKAPHSFYFPEQKYAHSFDKISIPYPNTAFNLNDKPTWITQRLNTWHGIYGPLFEYRKKFPDSSPEAVKDFETMIRSYWGTILSLDDSVGVLVKELEIQKQLDNTIIVFMGDNGLLNGEHGMVDKRTMHEPSIRIPLIVRYPKLSDSKSAKKIENLVLTVDMAPSLLELCGAPPLTNIQGKSWVKMVQGDDPNWRKSFLYHYNYEKQFPYTPNVRGVRTEDWKFIHYPHGDDKPDRHLSELYNLKNDPEERVNLIKEPKYSGKISELKAELIKLKLELGIEKDSMPIDLGIGTALPDAKIR